MEWDLKWLYSFNLSGIILTKEQGCCACCFIKAFILRSDLKSIQNGVITFIQGKRRIVLRRYSWTIHLSSSPRAVPCKHLNNTKQVKENCGEKQCFLQHNVHTESLLSFSLPLLGTGECILVLWIKWQKRQRNRESEETRWGWWWAHVFPPSPSKNNWLYRSIFLCTFARMNSHSASIRRPVQSQHLVMLLYRQQQGSLQEVMMVIDTPILLLRSIRKHGKRKFERVRWTASLRNRWRWEQISSLLVWISRAASSSWWSLAVWWELYLYKRCIKRWGSWVGRLGDWRNYFDPWHTFCPQAGSRLDRRSLHALHLQGWVSCSAQAVLGSSPASLTRGPGEMPQAASQCLVLSID